MVVRKLLVVALCILTTGLHGSSNEDEQLLLTLDQQSPLIVSPDRAESQEHNEFVQPQAGSFFSALGVVKSEVIAASLMLSNTFGRMGLSIFLGYKGYKSATKIMQDGAKRSKHVLRTLCYLGATCMLLSDGYQWVLRQGVDA